MVPGNGNHSDFVFVDLRLDGHCIQTAAKKAYNELINLVLVGGMRLDDPRAIQAELLRDFLTGTDFAAL